MILIGIVILSSYRPFTDSFFNQCRDPTDNDYDVSSVSDNYQTSGSGDTDNLVPELKKLHLNNHKNLICEHLNINSLRNKLCEIKELLLDNLFDCFVITLRGKSTSQSL